MSLIKTEVMKLYQYKVTVNLSQILKCTSRITEVLNEKRIQKTVTGYSIDMQHIGENHTTRDNVTNLDLLAINLIYLSLPVSHCTVVMCIQCLRLQ